MVAHQDVQAYIHYLLHKHTLGTINDVHVWLVGTCRTKVRLPLKPKTSSQPRSALSFPYTALEVTRDMSTSCSDQMPVYDRVTICIPNA